MWLCKFTLTIILSLPCLHTFWHVIPTSFYISNVFKSCVIWIENYLTLTDLIDAYFSLPRGVVFFTDWAHNSHHCLPGQTHGPNLERPLSATLSATMSCTARHHVHLISFNGHDSRSTIFFSWRFKNREKDFGNYFLQKQILQWLVEGVT